jgi:hypothetical protein
MTSKDAAGEDSSEEVVRLRAERDAALAELEQIRSRPESRHLTRRTVVGVLVVISCLSFLTGGVGVWASRSFLDTDIWVERVGPLADDPEVQEALGRTLTTEVMKLVDTQALFEEVLPERGQILAVPLAGAVEGFVGDRVQDFMASEAFANLWVAVNEQAHQAAVNILRGDSEVITAGDDSVTLNLLPVINQILARVTSASPELFGRTIEIPDVQIDEVPVSAIEKINDTFGADLPSDFGQITIYDQGSLKEVQDAIALFDRLVWGSVVVFVASTIGALALSVDRRRTFLQLAIVDVLLLILMRRAAITAQDQILDLVRVPDNVPAVKSITDALMQGLFDGTRLLLWLFGIGILVAWLTSASASAVTLREKAAAVARTVASTARDRGSDPGTVAWLVTHRDILQVAGVAVGLVLLWWLDLSWFGVLLLLGLVAGYELLLARLPPPDALTAGTTGGDIDLIEGEVPGG